MTEIWGFWIIFLYSLKSASCVRSSGGDKSLRTRGRFSGARNKMHCVIKLAIYQFSMSSATVEYLTAVCTHHSTWPLKNHMWCDIFCEEYYFFIKECLSSVTPRYLVFVLCFTSFASKYILSSLLASCLFK